MAAVGRYGHVCYHNLLLEERVVLQPSKFCKLYSSICNLYHSNKFISNVSIRQPIYKDSIYCQGVAIWEKLKMQKHHKYLLLSSHFVNLKSNISLFSISVTHSFKMKWERLPFVLLTFQYFPFLLHIHSKCPNRSFSTKTLLPWGQR